MKTLNQAAIKHIVKMTKATEGEIDYQTIFELYGVQPYEIERIVRQNSKVESLSDFQCRGGEIKKLPTKKPRKIIAKMPAQKHMGQKSTHAWWKEENVTTDNE